MHPDYSAPSDLPAPIATAVCALAAALAEVTSCSPAEVDLLQVESQVRELVAAVERASVQLVLSHLDIDAPRLLIDDVPHRRVGRHEATYLTGAGEVRVARSLYRSGQGRAVATVDVLGGIVDGWVTPRAAMVAALSSARRRRGWPRRCWPGPVEWLRLAARWTDCRRW